MLQEVIDIQQDAVARLVAALGKKNEITFRAPTGSGKTFMMADFMNRILGKQENVVFLVSSLSKGDLARQNYEKFVEYKQKGNFPKLNPYLINSQISGEERLFIPTGHNVYLLPRDLYKKGGRLMQGSMTAFLVELLFKEKQRIILIKDECHIKTKNLDDLSPSYFDKIVNFSATPTRGQYPDVEIKNEEAENANLIKHIEWGDEKDTVADALDKFQTIKEDYRNLLGVNPCLIIQISNKDKADEELKNAIMPALNARPDIKWMLIVDNDKQCDTNDVFKAKKMHVSKWKDYAKTNTATIDVIVFKMVITEGWDIPRACMLYQVRDTQSKQLDEQVMGRVRRNPRLLDFETLPDEARRLAMTAWVWGVQPEKRKAFGVTLWEPMRETLENFRIKITSLKPLTVKENFDLDAFLAKEKPHISRQNIFELGRQLHDSPVKNIVYDYATDYAKWWQITARLADLEKANDSYLCDYEQSMAVKEEVSFAQSSYYTTSDKYVYIGNWVWKRRDGREQFSFDSDAEQEWASKLKDLSAQATMPLTVGKKRKKDLGQELPFAAIETDRSGEHEIMLWGKNYVPNSPIKFEYYMGALHTSFPDFVMKDRFGRIHIFEVKSDNEGAAYNMDNNIYKTKALELEKCYRQASALTDQIFYLPVLHENDWQIQRFYKGDADSLTFEQFRDFIRNHA